MRIADTIGDIRLGMEVRDQFTDIATYSGQAHKFLAAFGWCLAQCDRDPEQFPAESLFWKFKWVGEHLPRYHQISRKQIADNLDDMERPYSKAGYSLRPVYKLRCLTASLLGDDDQVAPWMAKWLACKKDWNNDCRACEIEAESWLRQRSGSLEDALRVAAPILAGRSTCNEIPHLTYARLALPTLRMGDSESAQKYHQTGYRLVRNKPDFLEAVGQHLPYLAATKPGDALALFERHVGWLDTAGSPNDHFCFLLGSREALGAAARAARKDSRKLRLPRSHTLWRESGEYSWDELLHWIDQGLDRLATAFDKRTGNDRYARRAAAARQLPAL